MLIEAQSLSRVETDIHATQISYRENRGSAAGTIYSKAHCVQVLRKASTTIVLDMR